MVTFFKKKAHLEPEYPGNKSDGRGTQILSQLWRVQRQGNFFHWHHHPISDCIEVSQLSKLHPQSPFCHRVLF